MAETLIEPMPGTSDDEVAGSGTTPTLRLLIVAALVVLVTAGIASLVVWLIRPMGEVTGDDIRTKEAGLAEHETGPIGAGPGSG